MSTRIVRYDFCQNCACVVEYGDTTGWGELSVGRQIELDERIDQIGLVTFVSGDESANWFECDLCAETCIEVKLTYEREELD